MNFTLKVKYELISSKMNKENLNSFVNGVVFSSLKENNNNEITLKLLNNDFVVFFQKALDELNIKYTLYKNTFKLSNFPIEEINPKTANFYFAGIFFNSGSISNLDSSSYHLQMSLKSEEMCNKLIEFASKHIDFHKIKNKNNFVIYVKKNEMISDFLHIIGAKNSYFEFIDSIISRDLKNQVTRIFNLDVHNQDKMVDSHQNFLHDYNFIKENNLEKEFTKDQLVFYEFKKNNEFLPLSELSQELFKQKNIKKTKGGLNHWLIKLRNVCKKHY